LYDIFVGTNSVRGSRGIYTLHLTDAGVPSIAHTHPAYNAGYLALDGARLFAVSEGMTFQGLASGGVTAYAIAPDGSLTETGSRPTGGQRPCCLCAGTNEVWVSNFYGGLCPVYPVAPDGAIEPARMVIDEPPLPGLPKALHCVGLLPDGGTVGVVSLSQMALLLYDTKTGARRAAYAPADGRHPRHFAPSPDGHLLYLLMQEPAEIHVLAWDGAALALRQIVPLDDAPLVLGASAVRVSPDGRYVLAAVRDTAALHILRVSGDTLAPVGQVQLPGDVPRDFTFTPDGRFVVAALQYSDRISVHRFADGTLTQCAVLDGVPSPASIVIREALT
jgi:6-phosphogluconolactonase